MTTDLRRDEVAILETYRKAKALRFSEISMAIEDGLLKKLNLTEKYDPNWLQTISRSKD